MSAYSVTSQLSVRSSFLNFSVAPIHVGPGRGNDSNSSLPTPDRRTYIRRKTKGNRVLMFGRIRELALYRAAVLRDRGFDVFTPNDVAEAANIIRNGNFDIAVLTYTLPNDVVQELTQLIREHCPNCPLIVISRNKRIDREIRPDEMVDADDGPDALIAALRRVTHTH